jgi:hypothetical protein
MSSATAYDRNGTMPEALQSRERQGGKQMPDVKTRGRGIESAVDGDLLAGEEISQPFGGVVDEPAPFQFAIQVHQPLLYNRV